VSDRFDNPLDLFIADPFVIEDNGTYYLYGTDDIDACKGVPVFSSTDMREWKYEGLAFEKTEDTWCQVNFWGPEVAKVGDEFLMYLNASPNSTPAPPFNMHLCIAKSKSPLGPFIEYKVPFYSAKEGDDAIDQHIFMDDDGQAFLYITYVNAKKHQNEIRVVKLKDDLEEFDGEPIVSIIPTQDWESRSWESHTVTEGAAVIKHKDYYYLTYTGNHFLDEYYAIGYAVSRNPMGPWKKHNNNPILKRTAKVRGTGNGCFVRSPDGTEVFMVYHTHCNPGQVYPRRTAVDLVRFEPTESGPDILVVDGPTYKEGHSVQQEHAFKSF